jgi:hypothetical protein
MKLRKLLLAGLCVTSLMTVAVPMAAQAATSVYLTVPPPENRREAVPAARRGYVWVPGYWDASGRRHVWKAGHWEKARRGYTYSAPAWVQRDNRWELNRGRWNRTANDRDGDGVPNSRDRAPNNPTRQ